MLNMTLEEESSSSSDESSPSASVSSDGSEKRKRSETEPAASSDKPPKLTKTTSVRISVSPNNPEYDPVVVSFPRGVPNSLNGKATDGRDSSAPAIPPLFSLSKPKASSSRGLKITGSDDTCTYMASAAGRGHDGRLTKLFVGVFDKKEKTLRLIPAAEKGTIFALEQTVKEYHPNVEDDSMMVGSGNGIGGGNVLSASDRVKMLVESFGSKKKQKVMSSKAANMVNIISVVGAGDAMMTSVSKQGDAVSSGNRQAMEDSSKTLDAVEVALMQARRAFLPPFDDNTDDPQKIYNVQLITDSAAWDRCSKIVDKSLKKAEENKINYVDVLLGEKGYKPESIVQLFSSISPSKKGSAYRIKTVFFLSLMMRFHSKIKKGFMNGTLDDCINKCHVPQEVGARLFELFTAPKEGRDQGFVASRQLKDKRCVFCLILYIIAQGKEMKVSSINQFCKDLQLDEKNAGALLREAGFSVKKSSAGNVGVSLSAPLTFPPPKRGKK